jgi:hypothetical protein
MLHVMHFQEEGDCSCRQLKHFPGWHTLSCCIVKVLQILVQFLKACGDDFFFVMLPLLLEPFNRKMSGVVTVIIDMKMQ